MQLFDEDIKEYTLDKDTKCLNTAVIVMSMYLGETATKITAQCDVENVGSVYRRQKDYVQGVNPNDPSFVPSNVSIKMLRRKLLQENNDRSLFYIMITNADVHMRSNPKDTIMFPGHVFVIEKYSNPSTENTDYYIYQSYINEYTLNGAYEKNRFTFKIDRNLVATLLDELEKLNLPDATWTETTTHLWKRLTHVNAKEFEGRTFRNLVHVCFRRIPINKCTNEFKRFLSKKLKESERLGNVEKSAKIKSLLDKTLNII